MNNDQILDETPEKLSVDISALVRSQSFFTDVEAVNTLLGPVKSVVKSLEFKITTLADCFVKLIKLSQELIHFHLFPIMILSISVLRFLDRKSTRLNSSHDQISYAVFCLKKKKNHL